MLMHQSICLKPVSEVRFMLYKMLIENLLFCWHSSDSKSPLRRSKRQEKMMSKEGAASYKERSKHMIVTLVTLYSLLLIFIFPLTCTRVKVCSGILYQIHFFLENGDSLIFYNVLIISVNVLLKLCTNRL